MMRMAGHLGIDVSDSRVRELADEAAIGRIRARAGDVAPEAHVGLWKDTAAFFRSGGSGEWQNRMSRQQQERYQQRIVDLMNDDLAAWVHQGLRGQRAAVQLPAIEA